MIIKEICIVTVVLECHIKCVSLPYHFALCMTLFLGIEGYISDKNGNVDWLNGEDTDAENTVDIDFQKRYTLYI